MRHAAFLLLSCALAAAAAAPQLDEAEVRRIRAICFRLGENEPGKKWDAARALVREGPQAVAIVAELLQGDWLEGKRMAAWVLDQIHAPEAVGPLAKALDDKDDDVRWKAAVGLKRLRHESVVHLVAMLFTGKLHAKRCAAWTLGEIGHADGAGALASALEEDDDELRWKAAVALTQIGKPSLPALQMVMKSKEVETRRCTVWAAGQIGGPEALPVLEQALQDADNHVRAKAVVALGNIRGEAATKLLLGMVDDADAVVRKDAIVALGRRGRSRQPGDPVVKKPADVADEAPLFGIYEITLRAKAPPPNPFADAKLVAAFVAPDDRNVRVAGFYAGDGAWKARMLLDKPGLWYYRADLTIGKEKTTSHGGVRCIARKAKGLLRVSQKSPRALAFDDGTPFHSIGAGAAVLGNPGQDGPPANTLDVWRTYLDDCARSGMNKCRILLIEAPWVPLATVRKHPELSPWPVGDAYDLRRFSIPYWDKLDAVIQHAAKLGVIVELTVFDETGLSPSNGDPWARHPFHRANGGPIDARAGSPAFYDVAAKATLAAQESYVGYLLARTAAYSNVVYELNNEMNRRNSARQFGLRWAEHWAAFLREHDPFDHLVSLSVAENGQAYFLIQGIDVANVHGKEPPEPQGIRIPVVFNEPYVKTPREERGAFWRSLLVGVSASHAPWQSQLTA